MAADSRASSGPIINPNPMLDQYYRSFESRIGYRLVLGDTRHHGWYEEGTYWPFPVGKALRRMEEKLFQALGLPEGSQVLDAGCGVGHVALYMARRGLRITGIDYMDIHVAKAKRNVARAADLPTGAVTVQRMDYHHLESIPSESHDGVYTMETFVHATDPEAVLAGFHRILRPGGRVALIEYYNSLNPATASDAAPRKAVEDMELVNKWAAMPTNARADSALYKQLLEEAGFADVQIVDLSANIRPMLRLFYWLAIVPYFFVKLLHLERWFVNTVAGAQAYRHQEHWRYVQVTATKPGGTIEGAKVK
ncbi:hypothetical protein VTJ83DRAFT_6006 [Remersonia thermophila]|uniref:Methyltransferase type 11 domain-containing protein n=1 Tax=Remersonia thermophila TaxID=72144 RepID=A0ABR4DAM2_9PEZI